MTLKELKKTNWAKNFKKECPTSYKDALNHIMSAGFQVEIQKTNETGEMLWAIVVCDGSKEFWMDARKTKKEAIALCKDMGWKYYT